MNTSPLLASDVWIDHPQGRLFSRLWRHTDANQLAGKTTPIVLFHDSLGCVDLWRDFPALLAVATGRDVIAYDRLGFGRSDRREGKLALDFIADEARTYFPLVCERMKVDRFIAFGHSVGGGMAVHCAAQYPERCEGLITESAQAFVGEETRAAYWKPKGGSRTHAPCRAWRNTTAAKRHGCSMPGWAPGSIPHSRRGRCWMSCRR